MGTSRDLKYANWLDKRERLPRRRAKKFNNLNFLAFLCVCVAGGFFGHAEAANVFRPNRNDKRSGKIVAAFPAGGKNVGVYSGLKISWLNFIPNCCCLQFFDKQN